MPKFRVDIDLSASMCLDIEADSFEEAESKANAEMYDEDAFIDAHRKDIFVWCPVIEQIVKED